jgi:hypothetical protein
MQAQVLVIIPCLSIVDAASYPCRYRFQGGANPRYLVEAMNEQARRGGSTPSRSHTIPEIENLLQEGIDAARSGHAQRARDCLLQVLEQDPSSVKAWLWLSDVVDTLREKELCLEQVIRIDPGHVAARRGLAFLKKQWQEQENGPLGPRSSVLHGAPGIEPLPALRPSSAATSLPPMGEVVGPASVHLVPDPPVPDIVDIPQQSRGQMEAVAMEPSQIGVDDGGSPVEDRDDLMRSAIAAARSGHIQRARELLGRVITMDERHVSAWMWLSYVASDEEERDRCLRKALTLALPGMTPSPAPAGAMAGALAATSWQAAPVARPVARPAPPRPSLADAALFDGAGITARLRTLYLEQATTWTFIALAYLAAIAIAEILTTFAPPRTGLVAHAAVLLGILVHAARVDGQKEQAFLVSLAFAPLIRVLSLSLPLADLPLLYWYPITSIPLFAAVLIAAPTLGFGRAALGLSLRRWGLQLVIGLSGITFGVFEYLILRPEPLVSTLEWTDLLWPALILLVSTGLLEELIFRGLLQRAAIDLLGIWGIGFVAILFAVLHTGYRSLPDVLFVAVVGLFFGWVVHRTRSLLGVTLAHGLTNILLFLIMPFVLG